MKNIITMLIILSFVGIAVFGFIGMGAHTADHNSNGCIAALQKETGCPLPQNPLDFAIFHISAFKIFSSANMGAAVYLSALLIALALLVIVFKFLEPKLFALQITSTKFSRYTRSYDFYTPNELKFIRWFTLHEDRYAAF